MLTAHPTPPHPTPPHLKAMPCWVWQHVCRGGNAAARTLLSPPHPAPPHLKTMPCWAWPQVCVIVPSHPTASEDDAMLSVTARMSRREHSCKDVIVPPHPTPPHLKTMPCWACPQVCQRKERSCKDVIVPPHPTPPHLKTMPCWVWQHVCRGGNAAARTPHPTLPYPTASEDDAMLSVALGDDAMQSVAAQILVAKWRGFGFRIARILVAESSCFGCGIVLFWLRNLSFFGCGSVFFWLRKRLWVWLRNRRNLVAEASKFGCGIGLYSWQVIGEASKVHRRHRSGPLEAREEVLQWKNRSWRQKASVRAQHDNQARPRFHAA